MFGMRRIFLLSTLFGLVLCAQFTAVEANQPTVGLILNDPGSFDSYTLFSPLRYNATFLIDHDGNLVHTWPAAYPPTINYLQQDGMLLRGVWLGQHPRFSTGGATGRVERVAWDGTVTWQFDYDTNDHVIHHDIRELPNGNVLMIAEEAQSSAEANAAGRDPGLLATGELWPDYIIEVHPTGPATGDIVWEWHVWDHLIQHFDNTKANYGDVADHPELVDVNYVDASQTPNGEADWLHSNAIDYNPALDQIMISVRHFSEFWVIDHSTTTAEAAGHTGGNSAKGGDILYRWGNPQAYGAGTSADRVFYLQHDAHWLVPGLPGAGDILVFNNGNGRPGGNSSSVDELIPPSTDGQGNYPYSPGQPYGPAGLTWTYAAPNPTDFFDAFISGATRLPNGDTLIDDGVFGKFFEVTSAGATVWKYVNPVTNSGPLAQGATPPPLSNFVFRAYPYAATYAGLAGHDLTAGAPLEITDSDGDGLSNLDELKLYGTDPQVADTDGDGCKDGREIGSDESKGGMRDPLNPWDYFNPSHDGQNRIDDILLVVRQYFIDSGNTAYNADTDRTLPMGAPHLWNLGPPNGIQRLDDILIMLNQYYNDCAP
jgi:hypothetical protein